MLFKFPVTRTGAPMRCEYLPSHLMLCSLFAEKSPVMDFLKDLFQQHSILTVSDWDEIGGPHLFEKYKLDNATRKEFRDAVGAPFKPMQYIAARVLPFHTHP